MLRIHLTTAEQRHVARAVHRSTDPRLRRRYQALLMVHRGYARQRIAAALDIHRTTLTQWLLKYRIGGLASLRMRDLPGPRQRIPDTLAPTIRRWVKEGPQGTGLRWEMWTYEKLAVKVQAETGIRVRRTAMRDFCQRHAIALQWTANRRPQASHQRQPRQDSELAHPA